MRNCSAVVFDRIRRAIQGHSRSCN